MLDLNRIPVKNPVGIVSDPQPTDIPLATWNYAENVRFKNGKTTKAQGHSSVFPQPIEGPLFLMPYLSDNTPYWFSAGATQIFRTQGTSWQNVSRSTVGGYSATPANNWSGGFLNSVAILNNPSDTPQVMQPNESRFKDLPYWPANYRCRIMRPFKNYLVALNITQNSVEQNTTVKWSSPADPGEVPFTWDVTDATNDAGENFLADTPGAIVDGKKLKDSFIIYKEDSVYAMRYVGGVYVFQFQQLFDDVGMLSTNCCAEFDGKHFVVGQGDVYIHNGVTKQSVIDGKMKVYLYNAIKSAGVSNVFVVPDYNSSEMWICFQGTSSQGLDGTADTALIWNWVENHWTIRDLPNIVHATYGVVDPQQSDAWDDDGAAWETDTTPWGNSSYNPSKTRVIMASRSANKIYVVGETSEFDGADFTCLLEKTNIYLDDDLSVKNVSSITPHFSGSGVVKAYVGSNMNPDAPTQWFGPYTFTIGTDTKIDCRVGGRYFGVRFELVSRGSWALNGYTFELTKPVGKR
jgi:hypothetical protein